MSFNLSSISLDVKCNDILCIYMLYLKSIKSMYQLSKVDFINFTL